MSTAAAAMLVAWEALCGVADAQVAAVLPGGRVAQPAAGVSPAAARLRARARRPLAPTAVNCIKEANVVDPALNAGKRVVLLGQRCVLQSCSSCPSPTQSVPPLAGAGAVQVLRRCCVPPSQSSVQVSQSPQLSQPPLTKNNMLRDLYACKCRIFYTRASVGGAVLSLSVQPRRQIISLLLAIPTTYVDASFSSPLTEGSVLKQKFSVQTPLYLPINRRLMYLH